MEVWVVSSEIIIKNVIKIFLFILSFSLSAQSSINIKSPQEKTKIKAGDYLEIIWSYRNLNSQVQVSYSKDKINWNRIDQVNAIEKSLWWEVPNFYDSDGEIYLKVSSIRNKNISDNVSLRFPHYSINRYATKSSRNYINNNTGKYVLITAKMDNI